MDASEPEVDFTKLPIDERCLHKNWKARVSGYEELVKVFQQADDEKAPEFTKFLPIVKKIAVDSNAAAQEKGLAAVAVFVENAAPTISGRIAGDVLTGIINKCLISSKPKTKETANSIVLMYIEVEKHEAVMEELTKGLENKSPKIVSACIGLFCEAITAFGPKVVKPGPLIKIVLQKLEDRDKTVRDETKQLAVAIYRWLKDAFKPQLSGLKPVQLSELEAEFAKLKNEKAQVSRYLRSEQVRVHEVAADGEVVVDGNVASSKGPPPEDVDPFEFLDPVEILSKLPGDFYQLCEAKKWQERKQALETLQELLTPNPKLAAGDYGDLVKVLKKFVGKDTNVVVVALGAKCLADLASRLRKAFHAYAHSSAVIILEKFKEKKPNVVTALREAMDAVMLSSSLEAIQEDITGALDNKNPQIKAETASFLTRQFAILTPATLGNKKLLKVLLTSLIKTLNDMDGTVRDAAAEAIGTAMKVNGEKLMLNFLGDVEAIKMTKIKEFCDKAEVKYPAPPGGHAPPRAALPPKAASASSIGQPRPVSAASSLSGSIDDLSDRPKKAMVRAGAKVVKPKTETGLKKSVSATRPKTAAGGGTANKVAPGRRPATGVAPTPVKEEKSSVTSSAGGGVLPLNNMKDTRLADEKALRVLKWNFTQPRDEFYVQLKEQMAAAEWSDSMIANCFHVDFKYHLKAITEMSEFLNQGNVEATLANSDIILKWVAIRSFDTNPSVILRSLDYIMSLFVAYKETNEQLIEAEAQSFFPYLVLKIGDAKAVRLKVHDILEKAREIYAPTKLFLFIMNGLITKKATQKSTCLDELAFLIEIYGLNVCQPPHPGALKEIAKHIADRDSAVRNSALNCVIQIYFIEGEKIYKQVGKMTDKDMNMLEERVKRTSKNRPQPRVAPPSAAPSGIRPPAASSNPSLHPSARASPAKERSPPKAVDRTPSPEDEDGDFDGDLQGTHVKKRVGVTRNATITKRRSLVRPMSLNVYDLEQEAKREVEEMQSAGRQDYEPATMALPTEPLNIVQKLAIARQARQLAKQQQQPMMPMMPMIPRSSESVEELLNLPDIQLPERRTSSRFVSNVSPITSPASSVAKMVALSPKADVALNLVLAQLTANEIPKTIEAFAQLRELLDKPDKAEQFLASKVDQIIHMCNLQYRFCLGKHLADDTIPRTQVIALFKSITNILDCIFKHNGLKRVPSRDTLGELMPQVINIILDTRLTASQEGPAIVKAVNMLATCIIINAEPTNMMSALIKLLSDSVGGSSGNSGTKFTEMVMKCIWKMVRFIEQYIGELNVDRIILDIHNFMVKYPSSFWRADPNRADTPLRTVKTITFLLVQHKGNEIQDHLSLVTDRSSSELYQYIQRALKQVGKVNPVKTEPGQAEHQLMGHETVGSDSARSTPVKSVQNGMQNGGALSNTLGHLLSTQESESLAAILDKLGSDNAQEGFFELDQFVKDHPSFKLESHLLQSTTEMFRSFVLKGLSQINGEARPRDQQVVYEGGDREDKTTNGNGKSPARNGTPVRDVPLFTDTTPRLPVRSKLGVLSGNTSIPVRSTSSPRRTPQAIPTLPPPEQMTKEDAFEWLKACTGLLGRDPAKYNDPEFIENMMRSVNEKYTFTDDPAEDTKIAQRMVEDAQETLRVFKKKFNISS